jgi:CDP-diacylglycerol--glycerol-3-phosphate 3-phosphatidyltransferase
MDQALVDQVMLGEVEDLQGLRWKHTGMVWSGWVGLLLLWIAGALTAITGVDYFNKAKPHLKD